MIGADCELGELAESQQHNESVEKVVKYKVSKQANK